MSNISSPTRFDAESHLYEMEERIRSPLSMNYDDMGAPQRRGDNEKVEMFVPERILVGGQGQFFGTTAPPRELRLENIVRPPDPGMVRVETPPRVISLSEHRFPTVGEDDDELSEPESPPTSSIVSRVKSTPKRIQAIVPNNEVEWTPMSMSLNGSELAPRGLPPSEEVTHLRRQMAKLNRRLMALELETLQRQQRERYLVILGLGYYLIKFMVWLNK